MNRERALALLVLILVVAGLFLAFGVMGGGQSQQAPEYSTYSYEPWGVRAFHEYLRRQGLDPHRLRGPLETLESVEGLLIIVEPDEEVAFDQGRHIVRVYSPQEVQAVVSWVERGNTVLLLASEPNELLEYLAVVPPGRREADRPPIEMLRPLVPIREFTGVTAMPMPESTRLSAGSPEVVALLGDVEAPAAVAVRRRKGTIFVIGDSWPITNYALSDRVAGHEENLRFLSNLAALHAGPQGEVYFDEAHHGFSGELGLVSYLKRNGLHYVLVQLVLVFMFAAWRMGAGFGRPLLARPPRERDLTEHVGAVANIYRRARLRKDAVRTILGGLARDLSTCLRLPPGTPAQDILAELEKIAPDAATRFRRFLLRARAVDRHTRSHEFVETCRQALELRALAQSGKLRALM